MAVNVRIEARRLPPGATKSDRDRATQNLLRTFKRACNEAGVMQEYKEKEFFVRKCDLRRRKEMNRRRAPLEAELKAKEEKAANNTKNAQR